MTRKEFVDTNVWVYAYDERLPEKRDIARNLLQEISARSVVVVSTQVLLEFFRVATNRLNIPLAEARALTQRIAEYDVVETDATLVMAGIDLAVANQISHWDGMIVSAAAVRRCSVLWTEDLNDGQRIVNVEVRNPFASK